MSVVRDLDTSLSKHENMIGVYRARVENNKDPLGIGRVQIRVPMLHGLEGEGVSSDSLPWASMCSNNGAGYNFGSFIVPEIGEYVFVVFEDGDTNKPVYLGSIFGTGSLTQKKYGSGDTSWSGVAGVCEVPNEAQREDPTNKVLYKSRLGSKIYMDTSTGTWNELVTDSNTVLTTSVVDEEFTQYTWNVKKIHKMVADSSSGGSSSGSSSSSGSGSSSLGSGSSGSSSSEGTGTSGVDCSSYTKIKTLTVSATSDGNLAGYTLGGDSSYFKKVVPNNKKIHFKAVIFCPTGVTIDYYAVSDFENGRKWDNKNNYCSSYTTQAVTDGTNYTKDWDETIAVASSDFTSDDDVTNNMLTYLCCSETRVKASGTTSVDLTKATLSVTLYIVP